MSEYVRTESDLRKLGTRSPRSTRPTSTFTVPGRPEPKRVASRNGTRTFLSPADQSYRDRIQWAWRAAGAVRFEPFVPLEIEIIAFFARPESHFATAGGLTSHGKRRPRPIMRPDSDNIAKQLGDALQGDALAFRDDCQIVDTIVRRYWTTDRREQERVWVRIVQLPGEVEDE